MLHQIIMNINIDAYVHKGIHTHMPYFYLEFSLGLQRVYSRKTYIGIKNNKSRIIKAPSNFSVFWFAFITLLDLQPFLVIFTTIYLPFTSLKLNKYYD